MHVILGAGGVIGEALTPLLREHTTVRLVSRSPASDHPDDDVMPADLTDPAHAMRAVEGAEVAYLVVGLPYKTAVWQDLWPRIMENTIAACAHHSCRLVFFDNIYMYDPGHLGSMDEQTPVRPVSKKGQVRAAIAQMLMEAVERGRVEALIARCADFYGPGRQTSSILTQTVWERLAAGKAAQWLLSSQHRHSFTYTPDAARATMLLGMTPDAYNRVWHLPTAPDPPTGEEWVEAIADVLAARPRLQVMGPLLLSALSLFVPLLRELKEMAYQYDRDYVFRSDAFERRFGVESTSYAEGIRAIAAADYA